MVLNRSLFEFMNTNMLDRAVRRVKAFVNDNNLPFIYVLCSGGKDSVATVLASIEATRNIVVVYTEVVGNTHRLNIDVVDELANVLGMDVHTIEARDRHRFATEIRYFIEDAVGSRRLPIVVHVRAWSYTYGIDFVEALSRWCLPRGYTRWCHHEFKSLWWSELPCQKPRRRYIVVGVRADESSHRSKRWLDSSGIREFASRNGVDVALAPIYDYSSSDVVAILRRRFPRVLDVYSRFGDSLNCVFCPLRGIEKQRKIVESLRDVDWSRYIEALSKCVEKTQSEDARKRIAKYIDALR